MSESEAILEARNIKVVRGGTLLLDIPSLSIQGRRDPFPDRTERGGKDDTDADALLSAKAL